MKDEREDKLEQSIRFVAKRYKEDSLDTDKAWKQFAGRNEIRRNIPFRRTLLAVASVLLLLVGIGTFYIVDLRSPEWVAVTTAPGQFKEVYLPDSTLISLAGNSSVKYDIKAYGKERRVVEMKGKAFFQVTRNEARPFSVQTQMTEITVLGTSFQINEQPGTTEVNVVTGKVSFTAGKERSQVILTAGMSATYTTGKDEIRLLEKEDLNNLSWKTKQLRFNDTPLEEVINDLGEHYQVRITNKTKISDLKLTATFNDLPLDEVLLVINQTLDVRLVSQPGK